MTGAGRRSAGVSLALAGSMAFLAGATDVFGLRRLGDLYVSFMSGDTTMLAGAIGRMDGARAGLVAGLVGLFVAGAAAGSAVAEASGRHHARMVVLVVTALLAAPFGYPAWTTGFLVLAMGALNSAMGRVGAAGISLTYVTGALAKFGQGAGRTIAGGRPGWSWLLQAPMWASLLAGGIAETLVQVWRSGAGLLPLVVLSGVIGLASIPEREG